MGDFWTDERLLIVAGYVYHDSGRYSDGGVWVKAAHGCPATTLSIDDFNSEGALTALRRWITLANDPVARYRRWVQQLSPARSVDGGMAAILAGWLPDVSPQEWLRAMILVEEGMGDG